MRNAVLLLFLLTLSAPAFSEGADLPVGSAPAPIPAPHFPDRAHAFIWRNWNLVETSRLAQILSTSEQNVRRTALAMGLPPELPVPAIYKSRLYLTLIRRNWHLLSYEQLLQLLDMSPRQLDFILREDDFLWVKLGGLKPKCDRLTYAEPDQATLDREAEIRQIVRETFGDALAAPAEKRFAFLDDLSGEIANPRPSPADPAAGPRFLYSYFAVYGDPLSDPSLDPYPDALLQRLADRGVNGVWLHVVLRQLAPSRDFPEFGDGSERRLENLRKLVQRARRFGIGVYLYMNEPRAMPAEFFRNRPEMAGVHEGDLVALCTSNETVRRWISDSLAYVFKNVPDLAGVFTITASENLTNCASHGASKSCPHCKDRDGSSILAEVNAAIEAGVHRGNPDAKVIVWDWGWPDDWSEAVIRALPKNVWIMSVSEWSLPIERGGVKTTVGEYSLSAVGPGPRALRNWKIAREARLKCIAKVQFNNSWELSAVPYLPVMDLVAQHCASLARAGIDGTMLSWTLGGYPSPNLEIAGQFAANPKADEVQVLDAVARHHFGPDGAADARRAWTLLSESFRQYPFDGGVIYHCPVQLGPANLLHAKPTGYPSTMVGFPYDDVTGWRGPYPADVFADQFEDIARSWDTGAAILARAADRAPESLSREAHRDASLARAASLHFRSVANQVRFVEHREGLSNPAITREEWNLHRVGIQQILRDEERLARELFDITSRDSRVGFEASNQYYYLPLDLVEKVIDCRYIARHLGE